MSSAQIERLRITEIFFSLQGESRSVGMPTVFIRLTGCPLRCSYCDTTYAFQGGEWRTLDEIMGQIGEFDAEFVTVTGGEPLAQPNCKLLLKRICDAGYSVSLETSGAIDISGVDNRVSVVMDIKTPGSGEVSRNRWANILALKPRDQVKFVIADDDDYEWSKRILAQHDLCQRAEVLFSPVQGQLPPADLADWILRDRLKVRFQLQLHKVLWGNARGR